jgi:FlaA1/EpsC-like NDP-sugar epimerase
LQQVNGILLVMRIFFTNKTDHHDIAEILLKVALNTITLTLLRTTLYHQVWRWILLFSEWIRQSYQIILYLVHLAWVGFELTKSVVIGTDSTGSCLFNYHTITNTTAPVLNSFWNGLQSSYKPSSLTLDTIVFWVNMTDHHCIINNNNIV